jgi:hypothetical protein
MFPRQHARDWQTLVHVCQRWRGIIFASPRRLDLHLLCSYGTPVRKELLFWPVTLPLILDYRHFVIPPEDEDNIAAALEHPSRVHQIKILATAPLIKQMTTTLQKSFPALTDLGLTCDDSDFPVISRRFLGGSSTPSLQHLHLKHISFPQIPLYFSSAHNLVSLRLEVMTANGHILPEAMVRSLAVLIGLETLFISFRDEMSPSDQSSSQPYPQMRAILPALTRLNYEGRSEYLEDFLTRIDTPRVSFVMIAYFIHQVQASQLSRFIERTENLKIDQFTHTRVRFYCDDSLFGLRRLQGTWSDTHLLLRMSGEAFLEVQIHFMTHLLGQLAATFSKVGDLFAHGNYVIQSGGTYGITEWLPFFRLFPAVETLRLSGGLAVLVASALEDTTEEMVTDVFPALRLIRVTECDKDEDEHQDEHDWIEQVGPMERFLSLRQLSGYPVTVINPEDELAEVEQMW